MTTHPPRPTQARLSIKELHDRTMRRFPKIMAELRRHETAETVLAEANHLTDKDRA